MACLACAIYSKICSGYWEAIEWLLTGYWVAIGWLLEFCDWVRQQWKKHTHPQRKIMISGYTCCIRFYTQFVVRGGDAQVFLVKRGLLFLVIGLTSLSHLACCLDGMLPCDSCETVSSYFADFWGIVTFSHCLFLRDCDFVTLSISERLCYFLERLNFYSVY